MPSGNGGQIAFASIASLYCLVDTLDIWTNFVSESLEHKLEELEEGSITGRRDAPPSHKGIDMGDGEINFEPNPNALAFMVKGFFGTMASSLVTAAGSTGANSGYEAGKDYWWHSFTPRQTAFSDRTFLEPHNVMVYRDVGSAWLFRGTIFPTLNLDIEAGALKKSSISVMARQVDLIERTTAIGSLARVGGRPWVWDMTSVEVSTDTSSANLAVNQNFERISFSFELAHEGVVLLDGTKRYAEFAPNDFRRINIEGTLSFRNQTEYLAFKEYENRRLRLTMLNVNSTIALGNIASLDATAFLGYFGMRIHIPQMKFLSWSAPIGGPNRLQASFTAKAEYDDVEGIMAKIEMNTNLSADRLYTRHAPAWNTVVASPYNSAEEDNVVAGGEVTVFYVNTAGGETFNASPNSATIINFLRGVGNAQIAAAMTVAAFSLSAPNKINVVLPAVGAFTGVSADTNVNWTLPASLFTQRMAPYTVASAFIITNSV